MRFLGTHYSLRISLLFLILPLHHQNYHFPKFSLKTLQLKLSPLQVLGLHASFE